LVPKQGIAPETIAKAIATYERTVVSGRAPFDEWIEGNEKAITEEAKRGFLTFNTKGKCSSCHSGWNFTDDSFHDIGLASEDIGRGKFLAGVVKMEHAFKTPGLREITRRGPYMHDGSTPTLEAQEYQGFTLLDFHFGLREDLALLRNGSILIDFILISSLDIRGAVIWAKPGSTLDRRCWSASS
jgi:hypothetical protein